MTRPYALKAVLAVLFLWSWKFAHQTHLAVDTVSESRAILDSAFRTEHKSGGYYC
jgi:hypothetical protein